MRSPNLLELIRQVRAVAASDARDQDRVFDVAGSERHELERFLRMNARIGWPWPAQTPELPPVPASISNLSQDSVRTRAESAWLAATRLRALIQQWFSFLSHLRMGWTVQSDSVPTVLQVFPKLSSLVVVAEFYCDYGLQERKRDNDPELPQVLESCRRFLLLNDIQPSDEEDVSRLVVPMQDFQNLFEGFTKEAERQARVLHSAEARHPLLEADLEVVTEKLGRAVTLYGTQLSGDKCHISPLEPCTRRHANDAFEQIGRFIDLLQEAPQLALTSGDEDWPTVSDAAKILGVNAGILSRDVTTRRLRSNGKAGKNRRIDPIDLMRWSKKRAERGERTESDDEVRRKQG